MIQRLMVKSKGLMNVIRFNYIEDWQEHFIRPLNIKTPEKYRKMYKEVKDLNPYPKIRAAFHDPLYMPGLNTERLLDMQKEIIQKGQVALSNQFIALLVYHLSKNRLMLHQTMDIIEQWIPRHKGQYTSRQIFGCLYGMVLYNRMTHAQFFIDEMKASQLQFQLAQALEMVEALNKNKQMPLQEKHKFWQENFKQVFTDNMHRIMSNRVSTVLRVFDAFREFQYYDEQIWDRIIIMMDNKTGWARTAIIERLYPITGTFEKAKLLFDKYYTKLSTNKNILWRYNLEQLRMYTSEEMIAKSQQNIQMQPNFRTLLPKDKLEKMTQNYERWLVSGAVKQQQEIIRDKSASFGYAIKDRFESLTKDNVDFSKLTKKQFEELFGQYDEELMKDKQQAPESQQNQQVEDEQVQA